MRGPLGNYFQDTVGHCFNVAVDQLGPIVHDAIVDLLGKIGIHGKEIGPRFDEVSKVLIGTLGAMGRVIVYKTLVEVCDEYSFNIDFTPKDSLSEKFAFFESRVLSDRLTPRRARRAMIDDESPTSQNGSVFERFSIESHRNS